MKGRIRIAYPLLAAGLLCLVAGATSQTRQVEVETKNQKVTVKSQSGSTIKVSVNGDIIAFEDQNPRMFNQRVMVPVRGVFEKLGAVVEWRPETQMVLARKDDKLIELWIGKELAEIDNESVKLDAPPRLYAGRTYVPLRFISEALGADVRWDAPATTVFITIGGQ